MMGDMFDKKREMIQQLMAMLKKGSADEVMGSMHKPEAAAPMETKMADGGMALASDEPEMVMPSDLPEEPGAEHPAPMMGEIEDEDEENNSSSFSSFLKRKK
jgi:hypothetical protein